MSNEKKTKSEKPLTFEEASARLEEIVKLLEDQKTTLDDSLSLYSEGVQLIGICNKKLDEAEQKITVIEGKEGI